MFTPDDQAAIIALVAPLLEATLTKAVQQAAVSTPTTTWRPGTCVNVNVPGHTASVVVDGDTLAIDVAVIGSMPRPLDRVMTLFVPPSAVFCFAMTDDVGASRPVVFTQYGDHVTLIGATAVTINPVTIPDQGRAGRVVLYATCRLDPNAATDTFQLSATNVDQTGLSYFNGTPSAVGSNLQTLQGMWTGTMVAGAAKTFNIQVKRDNGTGTGQTYAGGSVAPNYAIATFYPN